MENKGQLLDFIRTARKIGASDTEIVNRLMNDETEIPTHRVSPPPLIKEPGEVLIQFKEVEKIYDPFTDIATVALQQMNLDIYKGEFLAVTGQSGSGKSTLLNLLALIDEPTKGEIWIQDRCLQRFSEAEKVHFRLRTAGMIFQFFNLIENYTASENIIFQLRLQGYSPRESFAKAKEVLEFLGLAHKMHSYPKNLSGGEQQRVAVGRAMAKDSLFMLADEPTAHLDAKNSQELIELLRSINKTYGRTIILVSHEPDQAKQADRIIRLQDGKLISQENAS